MDTSRELRKSPDALENATDVGTSHDERTPWEKPVLLSLSVDQSEGVFPDFTDESDFKSAS